MARQELTRLQGALAIASFSAGVVIGAICLFLIEPFGEISNSAMYLVSELLVLCGGILGVKASTDARITQIETRYQSRMGENDNETTKD